MDDTIIDMRDVFLKRKIKNLQSRERRLAPDRNHEFLEEISITLKVIMGDVDLYLRRSKNDRRKVTQNKLKIIQLCCKEIDDYIAGKRF